MESFRIDILNPKAKLLLKNLADLKLIRIKKEKSISSFSELIEKLRTSTDKAPSLEDITSEVEEERKSRYEN